MRRRLFQEPEVADSRKWTRDGHCRQRIEVGESWPVAGSECGSRRYRRCTIVGLVCPRMSSRRQPGTTPTPFLPPARHRTGRSNQSRRLQRQGFSRSGTAHHGWRAASENPPSRRRALAWAFGRLGESGIHGPEDAGARASRPRQRAANGGRRHRGKCSAGTRAGRSPRAVGVMPTSSAAAPDHNRLPVPERHSSSELDWFRSRLRATASDDL